MDNSVENGEAEIIEAKEERFSLILQNGAEDSQELDMCRICFEGNKIDRPLIAPCECLGSEKFVHVDCLRDKVKEMPNWWAMTCPTCTQNYRGQEVIDVFMDLFQTHQSGLENRVVAKALMALGNAHGCMNDHAAQLELTNQALKINEEEYGKDHIEVAKTLKCLGNVSSRLGTFMFTKKRDLFERVLKIEEATLGDNNSDIAITLRNLGSTYGQFGNLKKQCKFHERSVEIAEKFHKNGIDDKQMAIFLQLLAKAYESMGQLNKKREIQQKLSKLKEALGKGPRNSEQLKQNDSLGGVAFPDSSSSGDSGSFGFRESRFQISVSSSEEGVDYDSEGNSNTLPVAGEATQAEVSHPKISNDSELPSENIKQPIEDHSEIHIQGVIQLYSKGDIVETLVANNMSSELWVPVEITKINSNGNYDLFVLNAADLGLNENAVDVSSGKIRKLRSDSSYSTGSLEKLISKQDKNGASRVDDAPLEIEDSTDDRAKALTLPQTPQKYSPDNVGDRMENQTSPAHMEPGTSEIDTMTSICTKETDAPSLMHSVSRDEEVDLATAAGVIPQASAVPQTDISDTEDAELCRYCYGDKGAGEGALISPCPCRGSHKFVHVNCLRKSLDCKENWWEMICPTCKHNYQGAEAIEIFAERFEHLQGEGHGVEEHLFATFLSNLGNCYGKIGNFEKKCELQERALEIEERVYGTEDVRVAVTLTNLGNAYGKLEQYAKKCELQERALAIKERHYGPDHKNVAITLTNLGNAYGRLGDYAKQAKFQERALSIQERENGKDHESVSVTLVNLGNAYGKLQLYEKQIEFQERALKIEERVYGKCHGEVAITLTCLGNAYGNLGKFQKRCELQQRALKIEESIYGENHPEIAVTLTNLGNAFGRKNDFEKQRELQLRALRINEEAHGPDHVRVATVLTNLGNAYSNLGDHVKQCELQERALEIFEGHYGTEHIELLVTMRTLGMGYGEIGNYMYTKECEFLERALEVEQKIYGKYHVEVLLTLTNIGVAFGRRGHLAIQKEIRAKVLEIQRHLNGIKQCMCVKGHDMILSRGLPLKLNGSRYRAVHCDGCRTRNIDNRNDFYHCTLCSFDYCMDCAKSQNVLARGANLDVLCEHGLEKFQFSKGGVECSLCKIKFKEGMSLFGCNICKVYNCENCYVKGNVYE